jgi:hypothetical protein
MCTEVVCNFHNTLGAGKKQLLHIWEEGIKIHETFERIKDRLLGANRDITKYMAVLVNKTWMPMSLSHHTLSLAHVVSSLEFARGQPEPSPSLKILKEVTHC